MREGASRAVVVAIDEYASSLSALERQLVKRYANAAGEAAAEVAG
jgi:hypothetical protein